MSNRKDRKDRKHCSPKREKCRDELCCVRDWCFDGCDPCGVRGWGFDGCDPCDVRGWGFDGCDPCGVRGWGFDHCGVRGWGFDGCDPCGVRGCRCERRCRKEKVCKRDACLPRERLLCDRPCVNPCFNRCYNDNFLLRDFWFNSCGRRWDYDYRLDFNTNFINFWGPNCVNFYRGLYGCGQYWDYCPQRKIFHIL